MQNLGNGEYLVLTRYCPYTYDVCDGYDLKYQVVHIYGYPDGDIVDDTEYGNFNKMFYYTSIYRYTNIKGSSSTIASLQYIE